MSAFLTWEVLVQRPRGRMAWQGVVLRRGDLSGSDRTEQNGPATGASAGG